MEEDPKYGIRIEAMLMAQKILEARNGTMAARSDWNFKPVTVDQVIAEAKKLVSFIEGD